MFLEYFIQNFSSIRPVEFNIIWPPVRALSFPKVILQSGHGTSPLEILIILSATKQ